jgi:acyl-CoA thioester hydrolase
MDVRDYECDLQGVVNNAVYQNYLEHARHLLLEDAGIDFAALHEAGIDPVVTRAELDYKKPLRSGDRFSIGLTVTRMGRLRFVFRQEIRFAGRRLGGGRRVTDAAVPAAGAAVPATDAAGPAPAGELVLAARIVAVTLRNGRPVEPGEIIEAIERRYGPVATE